MTHHITTGPHPSGGGCIAQYNHTVLGHNSNHQSSHHSNHYNPATPAVPRPLVNYGQYGQYGIPQWRPPGTYY